MNNKALPVILSILLGVAITVITIMGVKLSEKPDTIIKSDTMYVALPGDSVFVQVPIEKEVPVPRDIIKHDTIVQYIQSLDEEMIAKIVKDYLLVYAYKDTIQDDYLQAVIYEEINQNKIQKRVFEYRFLNKYETVITNKTSNSGFYAGGNLGVYIPGTKVGLGPSVSYIDKKGRLYGLNYDFINQSVYGNVQFPVFRKK